MRKIKWLAGLCGLLLLAGCAEKSNILGPELSEEPVSLAESIDPHAGFAKNSLTGLYDIPADKLDSRPVSIMINNLEQAQKVQTGLQGADLVYEVEVEGGISRYMAVYKHIAAAPDIGTIRSARYTYGDLAMGHDAIFIHHGIDKGYATPHFKDIGLTRYEIGDPDPGYRSNPFKLGVEHTLFTVGTKLDAYLDKQKARRTTDRTAPWQPYLEPEESVTPTAGGVCNSLAVNYSARYISRFDYDSNIGRYLRLQNAAPHKDYKTGQQLAVDNVFVLYTRVYALSDKVHMKSDLDSGDGIYASKGGYEPILWKKGSAGASFVMTRPDGSALTPNTGKGWICIQSQARPAVITGAPEPSSEPAE